MSKLVLNLFDNHHVRKFLGFALGSFGGILISFMTIFFLNITLSKKGMGNYSYVFNLVNLIYPVISLSISSGYVRFISIYREDLLVSFVQKMTYLSTILFSVLIIFWFDQWYYFTFAFIILYQERLILARARIDIVQFNFLNIIQKILFLLMLVYMRNEISADSAIFLLGLSYLFSFLIILMWKQPKASGIESENTDVNKSFFLKFCTVTMLTMVVNWILTVSDQVIIKYYYGFELLAPYSVAYRIVTVLSLISGIFLSYYPGVYFKEVASKNMQEVFVLRKYFMVVLIVATVGVLFFKNLIYICFGASKYLQESGYFLPLLLGEMCRIMASVLMTFLTFKLQQKNILLSMVLISVLNIILNLIFVPTYGPIAAAYCTLGCFLLYLGISFLISYLPERRHLMIEAVN